MDNLKVAAREYWDLRNAGELGEMRTRAHNVLLDEMTRCKIEYEDREDAARIAGEMLMDAKSSQVKPGQFIKVFGYNGQVREVFRSDTGRLVAEIMWAKDIARSNPVELYELGKFESSSLQDFSAEIVQIRNGQEERYKEVLESAH